MSTTQTKATLEIMRTKKWHVDPWFAHNIQPQITSYLNRESEAAGGDNEKKHYSGWFALKSKEFKNHRLINKGQSADASEDLIVTKDPEWDMTPHWWDEEGPLIKPEDEFINVIDLTSAVTRNGGWCSAGSIEHRDQMVFASKYPNCLGHIIVIDTHGGSAYSRNDYEQGIAAARAAGQPVIAYIDGMCASAGVACAVQTDEIYVQHENCEFGCIGTMAAFYTLANGTQDPNDLYVYHELYDPESFEKNLEFRELANNGNEDPICQELAEDGRAFRELVKACRPAAKEEHIHGKMFPAKEVMGVFIDGVKSFDECVERICEINGGAELIQHVVVSNTDNDENEPQAQPEDDPEPQSAAPDCPTPATTQSSSINMKIYENINAACGIEALAVTEDGSFYCNGALAEQIDGKLAEAKQNADLLAANLETVNGLNSTVANLKASLASLEAEKAALAEQVNTLTAEKTNLEAEKNLAVEKAAEADKTIADLNAKAEETATAHATALADKDAEISNLNDQLTAKQKEIDELAANTNNPAVPAAQPAQGTEEPQKDETAQPIYKPGMTCSEKAAAKEARMRELNSRRRF